MIDRICRLWGLSPPHPPRMSKVQTEYGVSMDWRDKSVNRRLAFGQAQGLTAFSHSESSAGSYQPHMHAQTAWHRPSACSGTFQSRILAQVVGARACFWELSAQIHTFLLQGCARNTASVACVTPADESWLRTNLGSEQSKFPQGEPFRCPRATSPPHLKGTAEM